MTPKILKDFLQEKGFSVYDFSFHVEGLTPQTIYSYLKGKRVTLESLTKIEKAFNFMKRKSSVRRD